MIRAAYVCADPGVPVFGRKGASVHVQEVVRALRTRGVAVQVFATSRGEDVPDDLRDVVVHPLPAPGHGPVARRERRAVAANAQLRGALEAHGPFAVVYERYSLWSLAAMAHARRVGCPGLLEVNAPLVDEQRQHRGLVARATAEALAQAAFAQATAVLAVSDAVAGWVRTRSANGVAVHVVPNGVDLARFDPAARTRGSSETFTIGFCGSLKSWHGVDTLVRAVAMLAPSDAAPRLLIVGDGPERRRLADLARACGLSAIACFTGPVRPAEVPPLLARMDVAVAPYPPQAGSYFSPLKVLEYLAAGLPVVASDVPQVRALVEDGRSGLLCPPGDPSALAGAVRAVRADPALRARLGAAGRSAVRSHTWSAVADRILSLAGLAPGGAPRLEVA